MAENVNVHLGNLSEQSFCVNHEFVRHPMLLGLGLDSRLHAYPPGTLRHVETLLCKVVALRHRGVDRSGGMMLSDFTTNLRSGLLRAGCCYLH